MTPNVGTIDRIIRVALGVVLLFLALASDMQLFASPLAKYAAIGVGIILLATSTLKICPIYSALGLKTCKDC